MTEPRTPDGPASRSDGSGLTAGLVFVVIGIGFLLDELGVFEVRLAYVLPLALIATGVWILFGRSAHKERRR